MAAAARKWPQPLQFRCRRNEPKSHAPDVRLKGLPAFFDGRPGPPQIFTGLHRSQVFCLCKAREFGRTGDRMLGREKKPGRRKASEVPGPFPSLVAPLLVLGAMAA